MWCARCLFDPARVFPVPGCPSSTAPAGCVVPDHATRLRAGAASGAKTHAGSPTNARSARCGRGPAPDHDAMDEDRNADLGWTGEIEQLVLLGHDAEAAEVGADIRSVPTGTPSTTRKDRHMNPNQALWEKGDFTGIAERCGTGEELVGRLGITAGLEVLDLGCGDGTTAGPGARLGAGVLGVDIARNLVEAGNLTGQGSGAREPEVSGRRRIRPEGTPRRVVRPRHEHLRRDVRAEDRSTWPRRWSGCAARRPDRDGQLDPR